MDQGRLPARPGAASVPTSAINFRDVVNVISGWRLAQHFAESRRSIRISRVLVTESNRKQLVGQSALQALAGGTRTKDATAMLDALEMLDGDRIDPCRSRATRRRCSGRLKAKGHGQVLNRASC